MGSNASVAGQRDKSQRFPHRYRAMPDRPNAIQEPPVTLETLRAIVDRRRDRYAGADFSAAVVPTTEGPHLTSGVVRFVFQETPADDASIDYRSLRLVRRRLSTDAALAVVGAILAGSQSIPGFDFRAERFDSIFRSPSPASHLPAPVGQRLAGTWPTTEFWLRPTQQLNYREPIGPLVAQGLPTVARPREYAREWIGLDRARHSSEQNMGFVLLPDDRMRLGPVTFASGEVTIGVTRGSLSEPAVEFRAAWILDQPYSESRSELTLIDGKLHLAYASNWSTLHVYAALPGTNEILDWVEVHRTYGFQSDVVVEESSAQRFEELVEMWESETVEFKSSLNPTNAIDFVQSAVAFANSKGGTIYLGVDDNGTVIGVKGVDRLEQQIANAMESYCEPPFVPHLEAFEVGVQTVVRVDVPVGEQRPYVHRPSGAIYVRRGSHDRPAHRDELLELTRPL